MELREVVRKLRRFEIMIRKAVDGHMQGNFRSLFKGAGLEFDDVRGYQYGDDIRHIDWNVSSKGHGTFVKTFREDREQTVFFLLDVSASLAIGPSASQKLDLAREVCGILALSAAKEGSQAGLYCFTERKEKYLPLAKGLPGAYRIISTLIGMKTEGLRTGLNQAIYFALNILKRRSVVFLISDFIEQANYEHTLGALARRHDLVIIHLYDGREADFPKVGIIPVEDRELGRRVWVNASSPNFSRRLAEGLKANRERLQLFCKRAQVHMVSLETGNDYVPELIRLFKVRNYGKAS
jgi:uncharacterized protein (DUF58 family)